MQRLALVAAVVSASFVGACYESDTGVQLGCTELHPVSPVDVSVGGSMPSQVELSALMEFDGVAATSSLQLTSACAQIASELGTPHDAVVTALASTNLDTRVTAICKVATDALAHGHAPIAVTTVTCTPARSEACGGACSAAAAAKADCPEPPGVALHFGPILAMRARLAIMTTSAEALSADIDAITDIKASCIPFARDRARDANAHVAASQKAIEALIVAAGGP